MNGQGSVEFMPMLDIKLVDILSIAIGPEFTIATRDHNPSVKIDIAELTGAFACPKQQRGWGKEG